MKTPNSTENYISVHPLSRRLEFNGVQIICPSLRATDYKSLHCVWEIEENMEKEKKEKKPFILPEELEGRNFRIRKLTPRECFRLMGVDDADIDKIQASGISNSAQYKLAGNSIVVDVLYHLFRKMFVETGEPDKTKEPQQLTLF